MTANNKLRSAYLILGIVVALLTIGGTVSAALIKYGDNKYFSKDDGIRLEEKVDSALSILKEIKAEQIYNRRHRQ